MYRARGYEPEESIYNLIPQPEPVVVKQPRHVSKYGTVPPTASTFGPAAVSAANVNNVGGEYVVSVSKPFKKAGASYGTKSGKPDPTKFLKKTKAVASPPKKFAYKTAARKPDVVKASEKPVGFGRRKETPNFIRENALLAITTEPSKQPVAEPNYLEKDDYGRVPEYLGEVKKEIQAEKDYITQVMQEHQDMYRSQEPQLELLAEEDRVRLVEQLKKKWEEVNHQYQGMTHIVNLDTLGKRQRKEEYESKLSALEKSIQKLSKHVVMIQSSALDY